MQVEEKCRASQKASEHHSHALRHHGEAAKHYDAGKPREAAHHAQLARGYAIHVRTHAKEAVKAFADDHGKK